MSQQTLKKLDKLMKSSRLQKVIKLALGKNKNVKKQKTS